MSPILANTCFVFINLLVITTSSSNFIEIVSVLRTRSRRKLFFKVEAKGVYIQFRFIMHPCLLGMLLLVLSFLLGNGINGLVILLIM